MPSCCSTCLKRNGLAEDDYKIEKVGGMAQRWDALRDRKQAGTSFQRLSTFSPASSISISSPKQPGDWTLSRQCRRNPPFLGERKQNQSDCLHSQLRTGDRLALRQSEPRRSHHDSAEQCPNVPGLPNARTMSFSIQGMAFSQGASEHGRAPDGPRLAKSLCRPEKKIVRSVEITTIQVTTTPPYVRTAFTRPNDVFSLRWESVLLGERSPVGTVHRKLAPRRPETNIAGSSLADDCHALNFNKDPRLCEVRNSDQRACGELAVREHLVAHFHELVAITGIVDKDGHSHQVVEASSLRFKVRSINAKTVLA